MSRWIWTVVACIAVAAVAFFGGVFVGRMTASSFGGAGGVNRQGSGQGFGSGANGQRAGGGFAAGTVLKKDAGSLTIKLTDGGSRTVLISPSTRFVKSLVVTAADASVGVTVTVIGQSGSDGSITARVVTIGEGLGGIRGLFGGPGDRGQGGQSGQGQGGQGGQSGQGQGSQGGQGQGPPPGF